MSEVIALQKRRATRRRIGVLALSLAACEGEMPVAESVETQLSMIVVSGDQQSAPPGTELSEPVVVKVTNSSGRPVGNEIVNWRVLEGGGSVYGGASLTDKDGYARERWTLGPTEGESQVLEARAVDPSTGEKLAFGRFTATATSQRVAKVEVAPAEATLTVDSSLQLEVTLRDSAGNVLTSPTITYSSSNTGIATVSGTGLVTGISAGPVVIMATAGGESGTAQLTVTTSANPVSTVTVTPGAVELQVGGSAELNAVTRDADGDVLTGRIVTWSSGNDSIATVEPTGVVKAIAAGTTIITATSEGQSGSSTITVISGTPPDPSGLLFSSVWDAATGSSLLATTDGRRFDETFCSNVNGVVDIIPGSNANFTLAQNVMRVRELTESDCFDVQENVPGALGSDYYVRTYIRNDVTRSSPGEIITWHPFVVNVLAPQLVFWSNQGGPPGQYQWQIRAYHSSTGNGNDHQWGGYLPLATWHRFEWHVQFVNVRGTDADVRVWPRVYDLAGNLIADANTLRRTWTPSTQTLAEWYAAGNTFRFPSLANSRRVGLGTEGPAGALNSGQAWYYAGLEVRSDTWPGPIR